MALRAIGRLEPELSTADAAILVGDLTNFGDPPDAFRVIEAARALCPHVLAVTEARQPELAVVGHIHEGRGADRVGETLVLNAGALRDGGYVVVEYGAGGLTAELRNFRAART